MKRGDVRFLDGQFKVKVLRVLPRHVLVKALENYSKVKEGEEMLTRRENLQKVKAK